MSPPTWPNHLILALTDEERDRFQRAARGLPLAASDVLTLLQTIARLRVDLSNARSVPAAVVIDT